MDSNTIVTGRKGVQFKWSTLCAVLLFSGPVVYFASQLFDNHKPSEPELPSAYFGDKSIQYFPAGPEFKLSRDAQSLKEARPEADIND